MLQWAVNDSFEMSLDGMFARLDAPTVGYHQSYYVEDSILDEETGLHRWSDVSIVDHWVTGMTVAELVPEASTITEHRVVDTTQFGWNGEWQVSDRLKLGFDVYTSESERDSGGKDTWVVSGIGGSHTGRVDMNSNSFPDISVTLEDGRDLATAFANGELGNADYGLHYIGLSGTDVTDEITGTTLSGTLDFDNGAFKSLEFGAAYTERSKERDTIENDTNGGSCQYCNMYGTTFESLGADVVRTLNLPNFMRNAGGRWPQQFVTFDVDNYLQALRALDGQPILDENGDPTGETFDASRTAPEFNPVQSYDVEEETVALYLKANFAGDAWFASAGVRWISTDTTARTAIDSIVFVDDPTPDVPTSSPDVTYSPAEPLTEKGSYDKWLPSLNVGYWINPELLLRGAVAQVLTRPSLNQLAPTRTDETLDRVFAVFYDGNAKLEPVEADQADLSLEWYFDEQSVLNAALFWKDITNFITYELEENVDIGVIGNIGGAGDAPVLYDVTRPINGDSAEVLGFEIGAQHFFANGLGVPRQLHLYGHRGHSGRSRRGPARRRVRVGLLGRADVRGRSLGHPAGCRLQRRLHRAQRRRGRAVADRRADHLDHRIGRLRPDRRHHAVAGRAQPGRRALFFVPEPTGHPRGIRDLGPFLHSRPGREVLAALHQAGPRCAHGSDTSRKARAGRERVAPVRAGHDAAVGRLGRARGPAGRARLARDAQLRRLGAHHDPARDRRPAQERPATAALAARGGAGPRDRPAGRRRAAAAVSRGARRPAVPHLSDHLAVAGGHHRCFRSPCSGSARADSACSASFSRCWRCRCSTTAPTVSRRAMGSGLRSLLRSWWHGACRHTSSSWPTPAWTPPASSST